MKPLEKALFHDAVFDMADFLMARGFTPKEALKISESFWKKHRKKLKTLL